MIGVLIIDIDGKNVDVNIIMGIEKKNMRILKKKKFIGIGLIGMKRVFKYKKKDFEVEIEYIKKEVIGMKKENKVNDEEIDKWFNRVDLFK